MVDRHGMFASKVTMNMLPYHASVHMSNTTSATNGTGTATFPEHLNATLMHAARLFSVCLSISYLQFLISLLVSLNLSLGVLKGPRHHFIKM